MAETHLTSQETTRVKVVNIKNLMFLIVAIELTLGI